MTNRYHRLSTLILGLVSTCLFAGEPALPASLPMGGVAVTLGIEDVAVLDHLASVKQQAVHALVATRAKAEALRRALLAKQLLGPVLVDAWTDAARLPHTDGLARVVVVGDPAMAAAAETTRIAAPFGAVATRSGAGWTVVPVPLPSTQDEWTHPWHDGGRTRRSSDAQVGPPQIAAWVSGPIFDNAIMVAGSGVVLVYSKQPTEQVVCRDAASGLQRWVVPMPPSAVPRGPAFGIADAWFGGDMPGQRNQGATIIGRRVFLAGATPMVIDLDTGKPVSGSIPGPVVRFAAMDSRVIAIMPDKLCAYATDTLAPIWSVAMKPFDAAVLPERILLIDTSKEPYAVVSLDAAGKEVQRRSLGDYWAPGWVSSSQYAKGKQVSQIRLMFSTPERAYLRGSSTKGLICLDTRTLAELWANAAQPVEAKDYRNRPVTSSGMFSNPATTVLAGDRLWFSNGRVRIALDAATGKLAGTAWSEAVNEDCQWSYGTANWVGFKDNEWMHVASFLRGMTRTGGTRELVEPSNSKDGALKFSEYGYTIGNSTCGWQPIIAYGRSYYGTKDCGCTNQGAGPRAGLATALVPAELRSDGKVGHVETGPGKPGPAAAGWTQFGGGPGHEFRIATTVGAAKLAWSTTLTPPPASEWVRTFATGRVSQPIVAGGLVCVAEHDSGVIHVLDAANGKLRFQAIAGNRIGGPPVLAGGLLIAASHDGRVNAWSSVDGALAWSTRIAAGERRIGAYGQVETSEPAAPVTVSGDTVLVMSGRFRYSAEGVWTSALDRATGALRWRKQEETFADIVCVSGDALIPSFTIGAESAFSGGVSLRSRAVASGLFAPMPGGTFLAGRWARTAFTTRHQQRQITGLGNWVWADAGASNVGFDADGSRIVKVARTVLEQAGKNGSARVQMDRLATKEWELPLAGEQAVAVVVAGDSVVIATNAHEAGSKVGASRNVTAIARAPGSLIIAGLKDGAIRTRISLPSAVVHQGIAIADSLMVISGNDGHIMAYGFTP